MKHKETFAVSILFHLVSVISADMKRRDEIIFANYQELLDEFIFFKERPLFCKIKAMRVQRSWVVGSGQS